MTQLHCMSVVHSVKEVNSIQPQGIINPRAGILEGGLHISIRKGEGTFLQHILRQPTPTNNIC